MNFQNQTLDATRTSYRQIFKATSLFGGVQIFNILVGIIRVKFVAVLLGTAGVGIIGLLNAPLQLIITITGLGIAYSAVRDISEAHGSNDQSRVAATITTFRRWSWFAGLFGAVMTVSFAPLLSEWTFGNKEYTWAFLWLSIILLLQAISKGQSAILQGTRRIKDMAKASVIGSIFGLFTSIPLYYLLGIKGIVPAMIIISLTSLILTWFFARRVRVEKIELTFKQTYTSGIGMAKLGIFMTLAGFVASASAYILNAFISNKGGVNQVGLYNAGWGVVGQYTSLIFAAMATDYFPRLSAINSDNEKVRELVKQQAELAILIMTPLLVLMIITMPLVVRILYTPEFLSIIFFANITILGMQFKALSWAMAYVYLAKGNGRLFFITELAGGTIVLILNLLSYNFYGMNGLAASFVLSYVVVSIGTYYILNLKYSFSLPFAFLKMLLLSYLLTVLIFFTTFIGNVALKLSISTIILIVTIIFSWKRLNGIMDLKSGIKDFLFQKKHVSSPIDRTL